MDCFYKLLARKLAVVSIALPKEERGNFALKLAPATRAQKLLERRQNHSCRVVYLLRPSSGIELLDAKVREERGSCLRSAHSSMKILFVD